ncbi:Peroxisome biosynthesis protein pex1 [Acarospora aff. strigata]|nr:Peroxisome biosynthesis protein pex1 [Acarospora aff. strigata]
MPATARQSPAQAEVALVQLKNCLINLPSSLVSVLVNANTPAQNVIVELQYRQPSVASRSKDGSNSTSQPRSLYVGWTGMPSKQKLVPIVGREGINGSRNTSGREQAIPVVEIDATFGRMIGLTESQKVGVVLHLDPPLAHTVNIEPLSPADWEIIELHANFLELNLLSQIRALPNPSFSASSAVQTQHAHPLTLHLSPTSTANIIVTSLAPIPPSSSAFAKIAPDAEVIVAPKTRPKSSRSNHSENRSSTGASRKSVGGRSGASTVRHKSYRDESAAKESMFFRGIDRGIGGEWFDEDDGNMSNEGLKVWVDRDQLASKGLRGVTWVTVSIIKPAGLEAPVDPQQRQQQKEQEAREAGKPATKLVARVTAWDDGPDSYHVALSSMLCAALGSEGFSGGIIRLEAAPPQAQKSATKCIKVFPFTSSSSPQSDGLRFGGQSKASREEAAERLKAMYGKAGEDSDGLLSGPLTDGLVLAKADRIDSGSGWDGGLIRFDPPLAQQVESPKLPLRWFLGSERKLPIEVQPEIPRPSSLSSSSQAGQPIPSQIPLLVGINALISRLMLHLCHSSSVLLTGGLGSGKTTLTHLIAHRLRREHLYNVTYFPCSKLLTDETRVSTIKDTLNRIFMSATWGARLGGHALVVLDDLDKLCPIETELQVGGENGRSRQISEGVCSIVRQYCGMESGVVLLATGQGKESLNNVIVGGHVVREIVALKAPDKEGRRRVLELLAGSSTTPGKAINGQESGSHEGDEAAWMDGSVTNRESGSAENTDGFAVDTDLDILDLAGQTDGYMPGDLVLLVSRARGEALIRSVQSSPESTENATIHLGKRDFAAALKGFTPASLRNVTLQSSTTTFNSIGGLQATRKILLETLQYPTKYAPIFAQCPLRLRSGLLLYGYPGCGKTLLASAVAGECGLNFISVKGPEILNKYIGASEKSVRDLFERAEAARPCVLFFDEFDSIAPKRGHDSTGVTDRVVNQLLTQMDGAEGLSGVYVLAATSRPDLIDPALLRPGRLDKSLLCDMPDVDDRVDILQALSTKLKISSEVLGEHSGHKDLVEVARRTEGYSGADLQALIYNAQLEAIHDVLGDHGTQGPANGKGAKDKRNGSTSSVTKDFIQFRFGEDEDAKETAALAASGVNRSKQLAERAAITAKLDAIKQARIKHKQLRRGLTENEKGRLDGESARDQEVVIGWKHIHASLSTTRSSISPEERRRLERIYREFLVGRNGEMPNGQGPTEVGGRSSLM